MLNLPHDILVGLVGIPHVNTVDASEIQREPVDVGSFFRIIDHVLNIPGG